jgi:hypothetical protein
MVPVGWKAQRCRTIAQSREGLVDLDLIIAIHRPCSMLSPMYVLDIQHRSSIRAGLLVLSQSNNTPKLEGSL